MRGRLKADRVYLCNYYGLGSPDCGVRTRSPVWRGEAEHPGPLTSLDAAVGVDPVVHQQHQAAQRGRVERQGRLQPPQLGPAAAVPPVLAEVQHVRSDQPQVVHGLQLRS